MTIHTIDWLKKEALGIASAWNGEDGQFNFEGETYTEDDVHLAEELLEKIKEVDALTEALRL
jgi:hypothetical protein